MKTYMFMYFKEDEFKKGQPYQSPYPLPHYLGFVHVNDNEDPDDKIERNVPPGYKVGDSHITDSMDEHIDFLIDLRTHDHVTLV